MTTIRVKTIKRYSQTDSIIKNVRAGSNRVAYDSARAISAGARRRVHVITGNLKSSIHTVKTGDAQHAVVVGAFYGAYEEYGTRHRPPHPFLRPAVEAERRKFLVQAGKVFNHR